MRNRRVAGHRSVAAPEPEGRIVDADLDGSAWTDLDGISGREVGADTNRCLQGRAFQLDSFVTEHGVLDEDAEGNREQ